MMPHPRLRLSRGRCHVLATMFLLSAVSLSWSPAARAQRVEQGVAIVSESIASRVDGFSYRPDSSSELEFRGTALVPYASGRARVRTTAERTEIDTRFDHLPAPSSLGAFAVYVLWVITPEGQAHNAGAIEPNGDRGRLDASTPLTSFALIVTAEPHFAVNVPSERVVMQSVGANVQATPLVVTSLAARVVYDKLMPRQVDPKRPEPVELTMAHYAVAIAEASGAAQLAAGSFQRARDALAAADQAQAARRSSDRARVPELARESIQAAEDARAAAEARGRDSARDELRNQIAAQDAQLKAEGDKTAAVREQLASTEARLGALQSRLPNAASRLQLASQLLARWLVMDPTESAISAHLSSDDGFVKSRTELTPDARDRLSIAAGILLGIGNATVTVTPALQLSEDPKQLGLSQQRARAVMEWLASLGLSAVAGVPQPAQAALEKALAPGPGVDLLISFGAVEGSPSAVSQK